jgi:hypothetical protein
LSPLQLKSAGSSHDWPWVERIAIFVLATLYLFVFRTVVPSGDAQVYVAHIDAGELIWNPNHLLMDPIGYGWCHLLWSLGIDIQPLNAFKIVSAASTLITLLLFDSLLREVGVARWARLLAVVGLFVSRNFLTMALSEEFFVLQMPFLIAALWFLLRAERYPGESKYILWLGVMLGVATLITINTVLLGVTIAIYLLLTRQTWREKLLGVVWLGAAAVLVVVPALIIAYATTSVDVDFFTWMFAYQGNETNPTNALYGLDPSLKGVALSAGRLVFTTFTNVVSVGSLGAVLKSLIYGAPLEIQLHPVRVATGAALFLAMIATCCVLAIWIVRNFRAQRVLQVVVAWAAAYYIFNFLWDDSSDQFWFQILPVFWLAVALFLSRSSTRASAILPTVTLAALAVFNTVQEAAPKAFADVRAYTARHAELLREGDLELITGWDDFRWIAPDATFPRFTQINLMNAALWVDADDPRHISKLGDMVQAHLESGGRVIISRVYDLDDDPRPWDQLRKLGWPRERIQQELSRFEARPLATIGGVVFRELSLAAGKPASDSTEPR